jgi:hypothetical protein
VQRWLELVRFDDVTPGVDARAQPSVIYIPPQEPGVRTLRDFVLRARFGHFNGLGGACQTEIRLRE